jgi:hypothetical protein
VSTLSCSLLLQLAAWAGYEEEEIPDQSGPVLIGRCEVTLVVRQKAVYGNPDPARCLNFGLGKREFADTDTQTRSTFFNSILQTFGFQGAAFISAVNCMIWRTGSRNEPAEDCEGRSGGRRSLKIKSERKRYMQENVVRPLRGGHYGHLRGTD